MLLRTQSNNLIPKYNKVEYNIVYMYFLGTVFRFIRDYFNKMYYKIVIFNVKNLKLKLKFF